MAIIKTMETSHLTFEKGSFFQISKNQYNLYGSFRKFPEILETLLKYIWNVMVLDYLEALATGGTEGGGEIQIDVLYFENVNAIFNTILIFPKALWFLNN